MEASCKCSKVLKQNNLRNHFLFQNSCERVTHINLSRTYNLDIDEERFKMQTPLVLATWFLNDVFEPSKLFDLSNRT